MMEFMDYILSAGFWAMAIVTWSIVLVIMSVWGIGRITDVMEYVADKMCRYAFLHDRRFCEKVRRLEQKQRTFNNRGTT